MAKKVLKESFHVKPKSAKESKADFFVVPENSKPKTKEGQKVTNFKIPLGGMPLENKVGLKLIGYRLKMLLANSPDSWEEINREEHGTFTRLFLQYHIPLLIPFYIFFTIRELLHYVNFTLFIRHTLLALPIFTVVYAGYIFTLGLIAEETAEISGGRFTPQSGMRIAIFSSLILSFLSITALLPIVKLPFILLALFWHYKQLFQGARTLLNISENHYKIYRLTHLLVWVLLVFLGFLLLSVMSYISSKLGHTTI
ncbi:MAG: hypothetical protein LDLANPLL_01886 [Turneriella sp.]|nr:hypothetical protein [Turneriella sp.]